MKNFAFHIEKVSEKRTEVSFYRVGGHNDRVIHVETKGYFTEQDAREDVEMMVSSNAIELTNKPEKIDYSEQD
jgi:hypothetical protein